MKKIVIIGIIAVVIGIVVLTFRASAQIIQPSMQYQLDQYIHTFDINGKVVGMSIDVTVTDTGSGAIDSYHYDFTSQEVADVKKNIQKFAPILEMAYAQAQVLVEAKIPPPPQPQNTTLYENLYNPSNIQTLVNQIKGI